MTARTSTRGASGDAPVPTLPQLVQVRRVRDAQVAYCPTCDQLLEAGPLRVWTFRKSQAMHERGTGHPTLMLAWRETAND